MRDGDAATFDEQASEPTAPKRFGDGGGWQDNLPPGQERARRVLLPAYPASSAQTTSVGTAPSVKTRRSNGPQVRIDHDAHGLLPETRRIVSCGSSNSTVLAPTTTASTSARSR